MAAVAQPEMLKQVCSIVQTTTGLSHEQLDVDAEFQDIGIDSIVAMELMERLSTTFGITFTPAQFLHVNSVRELATYIETHFTSSTIAPQVSTPAVVVERAGPVAAPADGNLDVLLAAIRRNYAIDLSGRAIGSLDDAVDMIVENHLDQLTADPTLAGMLTAHAYEPARSRDIAIVGIACRFPDAPDAETFWQNLIGAKRSIREVPTTRWRWDHVYAEHPAPGHTVSKWAAMIDDIDCFDPEFFGLSPQEAALIDPQERLLMQETYRALQDSGLDPASLRGSDTGVFIGYEYAEYEHYLRRNIDHLPGVVCTSSSPTYYFANRISYAFDFRGPSESVNVNCASSAIAINRACLSLIDRECQLAVVGSACLHLSAADYVASSQYGLLSPDGTCAVFDNDANGFTRGEGVAAVALKRLDSAVADGDRVYGVIKSCHQSNRGAAKSLSEVRHEAITDTIVRCRDKGGLPDDAPDYIELNGYSKKWADSFEFEGIRNAYRTTGKDGKTCALGSLKGNIGHLEPVNAIASLIKVALSLHAKVFPPSIARRTPSTFIDLDSTSHPFYMAERPLDFAQIRRADNVPVRAGINAFADSGVNVHIALEEYLPPHTASKVAADTRPQLFVLSARNSDRLYEYVNVCAGFLETGGASLDMANVVFTAQTGREVMAARLAIEATSVEELKDKLLRFSQAERRLSSQLEQVGIYCSDNGAIRSNPIIALITPEMVATQITSSIASGVWRTVAMLWVHGVNVPWRQAWALGEARRISLPGYPFARERCWVDVDVADDVQPAMIAAAAEAVAIPASAVSASAAVWHFRPANERAEGLPLPPAEKVEHFLRAQMGLLLRVAADTLDADTTFTNSGLNSIGIAELVSRINDLLGVSCAPSLVFIYPDPHALAQHLAETYPERVAAVGMLQAGTEAGRTAPVAVSFDDNIELKYIHDILVPMRTDVPGQPFFVLPGADGSMLPLQPLCEALGAAGPVYGLEAVGLSGGTKPATSLDETVEHNLVALRRMQPQGPYRLLGYSNGGVTAFAMARRLQSEGERVEQLLLLDALCPSARTATEAELVAQVFARLVENLGGKVQADAAAIAAVDDSERAEYLYDLLSTAGIAVGRDYFMATYRVATASERNCRAYVMHPLPQPVDAVLVRARDGYQQVPDDYGWGAYLPDTLRVSMIDATHFSVMEREAAQSVAQTALRAAAADTASETTSVSEAETALVADLIEAGPADHAAVKPASEDSVPVRSASSLTARTTPRKSAPSKHETGKPAAKSKAGDGRGRKRGN